MVLPRLLSASCLACLLTFAFGCSSEKTLPESSGVFFTSNRSGNPDVFHRPGGDTTWVNLTGHPASDNWASPSPDGSRIVFQSNRNGALDVFVMNVDGAGLRQLTSDSDHDYLPSWTPDGRILFTSWRRADDDAVRAQHLYLIDADGTNERRISLESGWPAAGGRMSPDGQLIAFSRTDSTGNGDVWIARPDGSNERQLTTTPAFDGDPSFSSDGSLITYYSDTSGRSDLRLMASDGSEQRTVLPGGRYWYPRFSPDDHWLLFCADRSGDETDLAVMALELVDNAEPVVVVDAPGRECEGVWG